MTTPKAKQKHEYPAAFKQNAIQLALTSEKPRTVIAQELGVGFSTLSKWIRRHQHRQGNPHQTAGANPQAEQQRLEQEIRWLKRELEIVRQEREILKLATQFFAKEQTRP
jgi:transposase